MNRKSFLKRSCIAGACACGFGGLVMRNKDLKGLQGDKQEPLVQTWISSVLCALENTDEVRQALKKAAAIHYNHLKMDETISPYIGDIEKFISFIGDEWGWKIQYDKRTSCLVADENKPYCVCPMINKDIENSDLLCACSEGFAQKMFSIVLGRNVSAHVVSSVLRGDKSCVYKIIF